MPSVAETLETFSKFDKGGHGTISRETLSFVMKEINPVWDHDKCEKLYNVCGAGHVGDIHYAKFVKFVVEGAPGAGKYVFQMLQEQEGETGDVKQNEAARYLLALSHVYADETAKPVAESMMGEGKIGEAAWLEKLAGVPALLAAMEADYSASTGRLHKFRTCEEQLSKLMGNLDRLRRRLLSSDEKVNATKIQAEIDSRIKQVQKFQKNGIKPHPGLCVFNQIDVDKSRTIDKEELKRMFEALSSVYRTDKKKVNDIMKVLDADHSGDIDENEWITQLEKLPDLEAALVADMDMETGHLKSFRSPEERFAKILGNIDRLEFDLSKLPKEGDEKTEKAKAKIAKELASRRAQAQKFRIGGVIPAAGILVFQQLDKKKARALKIDAFRGICEKLKYEKHSVDEVMEKLDFNQDGEISEKEFLEGLDHCHSFKAALEKDIDPETGKLKVLITPEKAFFDMLRRQEGAYSVDKREVGRYLSAAKAVYKPSDANLDDAIAALMGAHGEQHTPDSFNELLETLPDLKAKLTEDYCSDAVRFKHFRSCGQQLSKLLANLDRLRRREAAGEAVADAILSRKKQVKKLRANGILPSPGLCVFNQLDVDKSGVISRSELNRLFQGLKHVYKKTEEEITEIMNILDSDHSGDIDENEWMNNLRLCPGLRKALVADMDPDTGRLKSYRSVEDQLAKLLGNIQRLEYDLAKGVVEAKGDGKGIDEAQRAKWQEELDSRKAQKDKMRKAGVIPSPGIIVFNQIDKKKKRKIHLPQVKELLDKLKVDSKTAEEVMERMDADHNKCIDEEEWVQGLDRVQELKQALQKDIDPDTGKLHCYE